MKSLNEFKPLVKLLSEDKTKLIIASIIIFMGGLSEIFTGYLNGSAIEAMSNLELINALKFLGIYFVIELTVDGIFMHYANSILYKLESALTRKLGYFSYKKSLNLPAVAFEEKSSGEIINRITNDADTLSFAFGRLLNLVAMLISSIIILIYIFMNSWIIGVEITLFVGVLFIVIRKYGPKEKQIHKERKEKQDKFTSLVNESIRGIREIKTLGIKNNLLNNMKDIIRDIYDKSSEEIDISKKFKVRTSLLKTFMEVGVFVSCAILLYYNKITLTFFVSMTYYVYRYMWFLDNINDLTQTYNKVVVSITRVNEILENRLYNDVEFGNDKICDIKGNIEFKNVDFAYPNEDVTLSNFNLKIESNKKVAIVGKSGQGKSTLFNLITRIFDVNNGCIYVDGIDIRKLSEESLRKHIAIIRQEPFIFNKTIRENFELVNENITLNEIRKYARLAYIDDYIMSLPDKYDTVLGEGGVNLSGGQKQRLSIARTLAKGSKIILFDEATSALDNQSQEYIKKVIDDLIVDHTVVIVAHRLSTIMDADIIHVVDKGKVVESGKHVDLLKSSKIYNTLYKTESLNS